MLVIVAGPSAAVLLPGGWTADEDVREFRVWLSESLSPAGDNWWVLREPRSLDMAEPSPTTGPMLIEPDPYECDDADEDACLTRAAGFLPITQIVLAAAVNGKDDHRLLAQFAVAIARRYGGLIDLDSMLPVPPPPEVSALSALESGTGRRRWEDRSRATLATLHGRWHEIPYRTAWDEVAVRHVVDADLLDSWLHHPLFRMVK
ncbi:MULTISPECIES: DUF6368 family protein [unclassified Micromonospora]|uniref:DUF6368 family protein n=1 Tax=unclassified Micromonospora TaxID=2617518 RepID=UPI0022B6ABE7|nr:MULTISPECIES: DUF6368 family protein [unclassified Micromonospora]MCZ7423640.1 DUF6368 family protein [Verrucosispora sp. WMMA2121]WBB91328.1 DUF6368 family protein [Verrucosispora sp. WMMC514]